MTEVTATIKKKAILSGDIWYLVFDQLVRMNGGEDEREFYNGHQSVPGFFDWLRSCRNVCHEFDKIIKPIVYGRIDISKAPLINKLVRVQSSPCPQFKEYIRSYALDILLPMEYDVNYQALGIYFLEKCVHVERVTWLTSDQRQRQMTQQAVSRLSTLYINAFLRRSQMCHLFAFKNTITLYELHDHKTKTICRPAPAPLSSKSCVVDYLHINNQSDLAFPTFSPIGVPFPPLRELVLTGYPWSHSAENCAKIWDFSQLEHLKLDDVDLLEFVGSIQPNEFCHLRSLTILNQPLDLGLWHPRSIDPNVTELFKHLGNLEILDIDWDQWRFHLPSKSVVSFSRNLIKLDLVETPNRELVSNPLSHEDLKMLQECCPHLYELRLNFSPSDHQSDQFLFAFSQFQELALLTLLTHNFEEYENADPDTTDTDYDVAEQIMIRLHAQKLGCWYTELAIQVTESAKPAGFVPYSLTMWNKNRRFSSKLNDNGEYMICGSQKHPGFGSRIFELEEENSDDDSNGSENEDWIEENQWETREDSLGEDYIDANDIEEGDIEESSLDESSTEDVYLENGLEEKEE